MFLQKRFVLRFACSLSSILYICFINVTTANPLSTLVTKSSFFSNESLPQYALDYAPYVYLHSEEAFWPSDINIHLVNSKPESNYTVEASFSACGNNCRNFLRSSNLKLNVKDQGDVYLTSTSAIFDIEPQSWLYGVGRPDQNGRSNAKAFIIAVDKTQQVGPGWVDVFYLFFYSYNQGNYFFNNRFGDHVGDWENTMIRFLNGKPVYITPEAHGGEVILGNSAYEIGVLEQLNGRPIVYSANGTHGMYPQPGTQNYTGLPIPIFDQTDKGYLWDPTMNYNAYFYSNENGFSYTGDIPVSQQDPEQLGWLQFMGYWGDQQYPVSEPRQTCIGSLCFYTSGPLGPQSKSLTRGWLCPSSDCKPQTSLPHIGLLTMNSPAIQITPSFQALRIFMFSVVILLQFT
ncbi:hypothetical protein O181_010573 [Austropuccinia psidii MF-1]|uniref:Vacuolar protein sorting-associated protein 62 n=1 Tax=Austropuccinia psidii MF-1 TaxID=1389203 RepID=A0A9Q3GKH6_9BASI|nr:hypothetical protein [Austropuccinia psidii MF-1]